MRLRTNAKLIEFTERQSAKIEKSSIDINEFRLNVMHVDVERYCIMQSSRM